jgi:cyclophilin family peptidyl-prolyl cis-trans isomerase
MDNPRVFWDVAINGDHAGRIIMELFADVCPRTCENFRYPRHTHVGQMHASREACHELCHACMLACTLPCRALCTGERGKGRSGKGLHYKNSFMHRIIPDFMVSMPGSQTQAAMISRPPMQWFMKHGLNNCMNRACRALQAQAGGKRQ